MGGVGSGSIHSGCSKSTTDDYHMIDIRHWQRLGLLAPGHAFTCRWGRNGKTTASIQVRTETDQVTLTYRHKSRGHDWIDENYPVSLSWSNCNYGGKRAWFLCPAAGCGRRVAILYGGTIFACRHCLQLAYTSQRQRHYDQAAKQAEKIRERLGWKPGILNGVGQKPKGMHWHTFDQLTALHNALVNESLNGLERRLGYHKPFHRAAKSVSQNQRPKNAGKSLNDLWRSSTRENLWYHSQTL